MILMVFKKNHFFRIGMWHSRPPPPFMAKAILKFHIDYLKASLTLAVEDADSKLVKVVC